MGMTLVMGRTTRPAGIERLLWPLVAVAAAALQAVDGPLIAALDRLARLATVFTNVGHATATGLMIKVGSGNGSAVPLYIGIGTGAGTAAVGDTTLFTETYTQAQSGGNATRVAGTASQVTTTLNADTFQVTGTLTAAANAPVVTNLGLFDAAGTSSGPTTPPSGGNLFFKADFGSISMSQSDTLTPTCKLQLV